MPDRRGLQQAGRTPGWTPSPLPRVTTCWAQAPQSHSAAVLMTPHHLASLSFWFPVALLPLLWDPPDNAPCPALLPVRAAPAPHSPPREALYFPSNV